MLILVSQELIKKKHKNKELQETFRTFVQTQNMYTYESL